MLRTDLPYYFILYPWVCLDDTNRKLDEKICRRKILHDIKLKGKEYDFGGQVSS